MAHGRLELGRLALMTATMVAFWALVAWVVVAIRASRSSTVHHQIRNGPSPRGSPPARSTKTNTNDISTHCGVPPSRANGFATTPASRDFLARIWSQ